MSKRWESMYSEPYKLSNRHQFFQRSDGIIFEQRQLNHTFSMLEGTGYETNGYCQKQTSELERFSICQCEACTKQTFINNSVNAQEFCVEFAIWIAEYRKAEKTCCSCKKSELNQECSDGMKRKILQSQNVIYLCCHLKCKTLEQHTSQLLQLFGQCLVLVGLHRELYMEVT